MRKFFINENNRAYLRGLADEFSESTNAVRLELNRLEEAGMLNSSHEGNKKYFRANTQHPLFEDMQSIVRKDLGLDRVIKEVVERLAGVKKMYLIGDIAKGKNAEVIDLCIVGSNIDRYCLLELIEESEKVVGKKIKYLLYDEAEEMGEALLVWSE